MNKHSSIKSSGSLLERASELYDFGAALRTGGVPPKPAAPVPPVAAPVAAPAPTQVPTQAPAPEIKMPVTQDAMPADVAPVLRAPAAVTPQRRYTKFAKIDRNLLRAGNFIDPEGPVTGLSEEFRIVKRQLLLTARGGKGYEPLEHGERILVCSAHPNEGKTYCSINLALSMASEKDNHVLLVDADFAKPSVLKTFGIEQSPGLMDALADRNCDVESLIIETDIPGSDYSAGWCTNQSGYRISGSIAHCRDYRTAYVERSYADHYFRFSPRIGSITCIRSGTSCRTNGHGGKCRQHDRQCTARRPEPVEWL